MSVYIPGMEVLAEGVYTCELGVLDESTAVLTIYSPVCEPQRSYKLVPVPPHGRLIDVDYADEYAYDELEVANNYLTGWEAARAMQKIYQTAPTIIPPDEPKEKQENTHGEGLHDTPAWASLLEDCAGSIERTDNFPAIDAVPVIRCRECKYSAKGTEGFDLEWPYANDGGYGANPCPLKCADPWYSHKPEPDFFCAYGERKHKEEQNG